MALHPMTLAKLWAGVAKNIRDTMQTADGQRGVEALDCFPDLNSAPQPVHALDTMKQVGRRPPGQADGSKRPAVATRRTHRAVPPAGPPS